MSRALQTIERAGRRLLMWLLRLLVGGRARPIDLPQAGAGELPRRLRIAVVRLDERLGNVVLLTPLLQTLHAHFGQTPIDVVLSARAAPLLAGLPAVGHIYPYAKWALLRACGPLGTIWQLRRRRYDLVVDAGNPTHPSVTHAIVTALSGARHTIGSACAGFGPLYSAPVPVCPERDVHEIALRLALLRPLGAVRPIARMQVSRSMPLPARSRLPLFVRAMQHTPYVVINVGARLRDKQLHAADYSVIANALTVAGLLPVLSYGPAELALATRVKALATTAVLAPPTCLAELAHLFTHARAAISCDTGPMHLAVALGVPTCGIFVSTDPRRYGHAEAPHAVIDARLRDHGHWLGAVRHFIAAHMPCAPEAEASSRIPWDAPQSEPHGASGHAG